MKKIKKLISFLLVSILSIINVSSINVKVCMANEPSNIYIIESLTSYKDTISEEEFKTLVDELYLFTDFLNSIYPCHKKWFYEKLIPGINEGHREVLFIRDENNSIVAISALKKDDNEKKICMIYVSDSIRGKSVGSSLIKASMEFLETEKPLITFPEYKLDMFKHFIDKYKWELCEQVNIYSDKHKELCYNGYLSK